MDCEIPAYCFYCSTADREIPSCSPCLLFGTHYTNSTPSPLCPPSRSSHFHLKPCLLSTTSPHCIPSNLSVLFVIFVTFMIFYFWITFVLCILSSLSVVIFTICHLFFCYHPNQFFVTPGLWFINIKNLNDRAYIHVMLCKPDN